MDIKGKRFLVLGLGVSGQAAARLIKSFGGHCLVADDAWDKIQDKPVIKELEVEPYTVETVDGAILSPGLPPTHPLVQQLKEQGTPIWGELEFAFKFLQGQKLVGITGTNGKTTTTLLTAHALGPQAYALGNVGTALSDYIVGGQDPEHTLVLELSSYQLESLSGPLFDAGLILNITPDHLDRYGTMEAYVAAKRRLINCLKPGAPCYAEKNTQEQYFPSDPILSYGDDPGCSLYSDGIQVLLDETLVFKWPKSYKNKRGPDIDNALAAFAICHTLGIDGATFVERLETFIKPPHRMEFVREINGVSYYNDSKATNVEAVLKAVDSLDHGLVLIAGGREKGASYQAWTTAFANKVKAIIALGEAAPTIDKELSGVFPVTKVSTLADAVKEASQQASPGNSVLLSPGCSSFDMFRNYEERGQQFKDLVLTLERETSS